MKKILIILAILILAVGVFFAIIRPNITGAVIEEHSYTKAMCNETNHCQDYEVICDGESLTAIRPITGAVVQHPDGWEDPRGNQTYEKLC